MTLSAQDKAVLKWFGLSVLIYLAVVDGGSVLYMIIATAVRGLIGYNGHTLPPETLEHPLSSFAQYVLSLLGFGVFFGLFGFLEIGAACASVTFFAFVYCKSPVIVRSVSGLAAAVASGFWMLGAVWYVAGHDETVWITTALGAITGAWLLPRGYPAGANVNLSQ
jgi:hypothetical protein